MKIEFSNVPEVILESIREDIASVETQSEDAKKELAGLSLLVVALENPGVPADLPAHQVKKPAPETPISFKKRCDRETERQSFQLRRKGLKIWVIAGGNEGALYGVQEVLRCLTGVIWAGLKDQDMLFGQKKVLLEKVQQPLFAYRGRDGGAPSGGAKAFVRWMNRNGWNLWRRNSAYWVSQDSSYRQEILSACASRCIHLTLGDHAMSYFLPAEEFQRHPDWFGFRNGQRVLKAPVVISDCPHLNAALPIQPCYSNPEAAEFITERMAAHMAEFPQAEMFGLWPHDGVNNWCQCQKCQRLTPYEQLYRLASLLARKIHSSVVIELIAYSNLLNLPWQRLEANERCFTMLCPYLRPYQHRIYEPGGPELVTGTLYPGPDRINPLDEREYGELFQRWQKVITQTGQGMGIFEYGGTFYDETRRYDRPRYLYHPSLDIRYDEARWYAERDVRVFYLCSHYAGWPDSYHHWALGKILWSLAEKAEQLFQQYYQAMAGDKGMVLGRALAAVEKALDQELFPERELENLREILLHWPGEDRVQRYRLWIEYVKMGKRSRRLEQSREFAEGIKQEREIQSFLEEHRKLLADYVHVEALKRLSLIHQERFEGWLSGKKGSRYTL